MINEEVRLKKCRNNRRFSRAAVEAESAGAEVEADGTPQARRGVRSSKRRETVKAK